MPPRDPARAPSDAGRWRAAYNRKSPPAIPVPAATHCPRRVRFQSARTRRCAATPIPSAADCVPRRSRNRPRGVGLRPFLQTRPGGRSAPARRTMPRAPATAEDASLGTPRTTHAPAASHPARSSPWRAGDPEGPPFLFSPNTDGGRVPPVASKIGTMMNDAAIVAHISQLPHSRANFKQLVRELAAKGDSRNELEAALTRLTARGDLIELKSGQYVVTARTREFAVGRLNLHRDGYGFLISERPIPGISGDIFISPEAAEKAMHGDRVIVRIARIEAGGRADGDIVKVLKRAHPTVVGEFKIGRRGCYVVPADSRIHQWIDIPDGMELPPTGAATVDRIGVTAPKVDTVAELEGMVVNVELLEYPERGASPVGRVVEIHGHPDDFGVDVEIIIRKHHLPHQFPPEVIEQAQAMPARVTEADIAGRRDFRDMPIVTIDGETARDFDDAVWVDRLPDGNYALHVHIADVSHYVRPGTPIDLEAQLRGTSVYFPDRAVPMLPYELSTSLCSLVPHTDRLVLSALMEIDHHGEVVGQEFTAGVISSAERMSYTNVHLLLEGDAAMRERYQPLVARFELMQELATILNKKRVRRGSIDFDLPEPLIEFDELGAMTGVTRAPRNIANRIIEEFMLAANECVAGHLEQAGIASIYRIHEMPDPKRVMEFEEIAMHFGVSLGIGAIPVKRFGITDKHRDGSKKDRKSTRLNSSHLVIS